jgi:hypothetical protein
MINRLLSVSAIALIALSSSGCNRPSGNQAAGTNQANAAAATPAAANQTAAAAPACAPNSVKLPVTGLCQEQAAALLLAAQQPEAAGDGCSWVVNEVKVLDGGALLYRALRCNGRTATLEFVPSAQMGSFDLGVSPWSAEASRETVIRMASVEGGDANAKILETARRLIDNPAERARCQVRRLNIESSPTDALVVDEVPAPPEDGVRSACGEFGYDGGAQSFWRVSQGIAWFFRLGNDSPPIDPASVTLLNRSPAGQWVRAS